MSGKPEITFIASNKAYNDSLLNLKNTPAEIPVGVDVETSSLDPFTGTLILLQIGTKSWVNVYDVRKLNNFQISQLLKWLNTKRKVIGHSFKFDLKYIYEKYGIMLKNIHDTMLAEAILYAGVGDPFTKYAELVSKYCYIDIDKDIRKEFEENPNIIITPEILDYSAMDVIFLPYIYDEQIELLKERNSLNVYSLEMRLLPAIAEMEHTGIALDEESWKELLKKAKATAKNISKEIKQQITDTVKKIISEENFTDGRDMLKFFKVTLTGENKKVAYSREYLSTVTTADEMMKVFHENFNPSSTYQMQRIMNLMGIPVASTNSKILKRDFNEYEFAMLLVDYRQWFKLATSFGENFFEHINPKTKKIHSSFDQLATRTGRFASSKPNMQNIKRGTDYRNSFIASPDYLLGTADYSHIELRLAAEVSKEENMLNIFREGRDPHTETAERVFDPSMFREELSKDEIRVRGKSLNFAVLYGTSAKGIAYNFQLPHSTGIEILERHKDLYPKLHDFIDLSREKILAAGFSITPFGRRRYFVVPRRFDRYNIKEKFKIYKEGFNHIIQGGSADMIKIAMVKTWEKNPFGNLLRAILTVHDEIVYEIHKSIIEEGEIFVREQMINAGQIFIKSIPVEVNIKVAPYWEK